MACSYADGLSEYHDKGKCGLSEIFDNAEVVEKKVELLAKLMREAKYAVVHTGAGISTSAGIPDFRGPKGVWTLQERGELPSHSISFNEAAPTITHMALVELQRNDYIKYLVSQNIDGLHLRSGFSRSNLAELHGNMFVEQCDLCKRQFIRSTSVPTVGQKCLELPCRLPKNNGRPCRGKLHDNILDWEDELPANDLSQAEFHSISADLNICLGTTLQIVPSGNLPLASKDPNCKLVICNLQPTKHDNRADIIINSYVDDIMVLLMKKLGLTIPTHAKEMDPVYVAANESLDQEWTLRKWQTLRRLPKMTKQKDKKSEIKELLPVKKFENSTNVDCKENLILH